MKIYLDDENAIEKDWQVVRSFYELSDLVQKIGLSNINVISLDHDLGDSAMTEYHTNVSPNYKLSYENIDEKAGYRCLQSSWLTNSTKLNPERLEMGYSSRKREPIKSLMFTLHWRNPIGSA